MLKENTLHNVVTQKGITTHAGKSSQFTICDFATEIILVDFILRTAV